MFSLRVPAAIAIAFPLLVACGAMSDSMRSPSSGATYAAATASWPAKTREVIAKTVAKYGPPQEVSASMLVWHNNGPWKRTIIYRQEVPHAFPIAHPDVMEQFIDYRAPPAKFSDLAMYDGSVVAYRTNGELSARCDKEEANFLAINLANDVATGKRTVSDARAFYAQTMKNMMAGQMAPYLQGFQFNVLKGGTADPDQPAAM